MSLQGQFLFKSPEGPLSTSWAPGPKGSIASPNSTLSTNQAFKHTCHCETLRIHHWLPLGLSAGTRGDGVVVLITPPTATPTPGQGETSRPTLLEMTSLLRTQALCAVSGRCSKGPRLSHACCYTASWSQSPEDRGHWLLWPWGVSCAEAGFKLVSSAAAEVSGDHGRLLVGHPALIWSIS